MEECWSSAQLQLCPSLAVDSLDLDPDLGADLLPWTWTYLVTMNLPGDRWAVSDLVTLSGSDADGDLCSQPDLGPASSPQALG